MAKNSLSRPEKLNILKRLITKFSTSRLSRPEMMDVLKRLVTKLSTSRLSRLEKIEVLKRLIKKYSATDPVKTPEDLGDESKKQN